jgi:4-amino-4-deoxy-L-arabinose transferase-like glycosyltransferase
VALLAGRAAYRDVRRDPRRLFLLVLALFGLLLFSIPVNKLPGYVLPLFPAIAALLGVALDDAKAANPAPWLACCGIMLMAFPLAVAVLPEALSRGLTRVALPAFQPAWLLALFPAAVAWVLASRGRQLAAVFTIAAGVSAGVFYLRRAVAPEVNRTLSARDLWSQIAGRAGEVCVEGVDRNWRYGLNYYSVTPLPECSVQPRPSHVIPGRPPHVVDRPSASVVPSTLRN